MSKSILGDLLLKESPNKPKAKDGLNNLQSNYYMLKRQEPLLEKTKGKGKCKATKTMIELVANLESLSSNSVSHFFTLINANKNMSTHTSIVHMTTGTSDGKIELNFFMKPTD